MTRKYTVIEPKTPADFERRVAREESQAERIIRIFGGVTWLAKWLEITGHKTNESTIYRWTYPPELKGTGGIVPTRMQPRILRAAKAAGIFIRPEEWDPRPTLIRNQKRQSERELVKLPTYEEEARLKEELRQAVERMMGDAGRDDDTETEAAR